MNRVARLSSLDGWKKGLLVRSMSNLIMFLDTHFVSHSCFSLHIIVIDKSPIAYDSPDRATPTAFLKSILYKLLEQNVSNVEVYKSIAQAFKHHSTGTDSEPTEEVLWKTLHECLKAIHIQQASIVILLDDCDEIAGGYADFYAKLQECISGLPIRVVAFSRSTPKAVQDYERQIETSKVREDIRVYVREILSCSRYFRKLSPQESEDILKEWWLRPMEAGSGLSTQLALFLRKSQRPQLLKQATI